MTTAELDIAGAAISEADELSLPTPPIHRDPVGAERRRLDDQGKRLPPSVSVVIPALNEERNLPGVLTQLPDSVAEVVLVDGRSTDRTKEIAQEILPNVVIVHQPGRGKGDALRAGFSASRGDAIVMLDADGSMSPKEIPRFVDALCSGGEFVKGSRFLSNGGSDDITVIRRLGNYGLRTIFNTLFKADHTDLCYGYAAFWRRCLSSLAFENDGFEVETVLNIRSAQTGLRVREVPSYERCRQHGESNLHAVRDGWRILRLLVAERSARASGA